MLYELLKFGHLIGLILIGAGLIGVFLSDIRTRQAKTLPVFAEAVRNIALFYDGLVVPGALLLLGSGTWLIIEFYDGWAFLELPWLAGMVLLFAFEFVEGNTITRLYFMKLRRLSIEAVRQGHFTAELAQVRAEPVPTFTHFLDLPILMLIVSLGALRPDTWTHFLLGSAVAIAVERRAAVPFSRPSRPPRRRAAMVRIFITSTAGISLLLAGAAAAASNEASTYAGLEHRTIKALSEQQVDDLQSGRGMGLALAAELNHYPGPVHVLEASGALGLSAEQLERTEALLGAMRAEAVPIGQSIIKLEAELEARFASGAAEASEVERLVMRIAEAQGRLRYVHLSYHLQMREVLSSQQLVRYDEVRGYAYLAGGGHRRHH